MRYPIGKTVVIALGGSVIYPDAIDTSFLREFKKFVLSFTPQGWRFVLVTGGGHVARVYQQAAAKLTTLTDEDQDWLGIHATRANAHLIRTIFREAANPVVVDARHKVKALTYSVTVGGGWHPGWSTDYVALAIAHDLHIPEVVIAGKPAYVYNKDPQKFKSAKPILECSWEEYQKLIPRKWSPGSHSPVDPIAAKLGAETGTRAIIVNGKNLKNLRSLLLGKEFKGTVIS